MALGNSPVPGSDVSGLTAMLGGDGGNVQDYYDPGYSNVGTNTQTPPIDLQAPLGGLNTGTTSSGWETGSNTGSMDTTKVMSISPNTLPKKTLKQNTKTEHFLSLFQKRITSNFPKSILKAQLN